MKIILFFFLITILNFVASAQVVFGKPTKSDLSINYSSPKEYEIAAIDIQGLNFLDKGALVSLSGLRVGDKIKIPGDKITTAIKKLWKQGIIDNVSIVASKVENNQVWLNIHLSERPRMTRYVITGINKSDQSELKSKLDLVKGKILTDVLKKNAEIATLKHLREKGYINAKVSASQEVDTILRNSAILKINVVKGLKFKIQTVNFIGNEMFTSAKLRSKLKKTNPSVKFKLPSLIINYLPKLLRPKNLKTFSKNSVLMDKENLREYLSSYVNLNFFKSAKYVKLEYEEDKQNLIGFYNAKGFRDAIVTHDTVYSVDSKNLVVNIKVDEGVKYYFRNIEWAGNYIYTNEQLGKILGVRKGDLYDLELINKKLNFNPNGTDISSLYLDDGYLFFNVNPIETQVVEDSIDVEMRLYEGSQATIKKVTVLGNNKTNDHVVYRELRTLPGDKFSRALLIRTQRELSQLGYFDPEQINPQPIPNPVDETVDINWELVERSNDQIELSGGWGGFYGFVGTLGLSFNNFSTKNIFNRKKWRGLPVGDGQKLSVRFQANGRRYQSYTVSFSEPWLGGKKPNSFGISLNKSIQRVINFSNETSGWLKVNGVSFSLGRRVTWPDDFFQISNSISYQGYDLFNFGSGLSARSLGFSTGQSNGITFNTTIQRSSADNTIYPRRGSVLSLSASLTPPYSLWNNLNYEDATNQEKFRFLEYHKWNFDSKYYLNIVENLVLASRVHFGLLGAYADHVGVGPFERFQLGGDGLTGQNFLLGTDVIGLRGYPNNSITPVEVDPENSLNNIEGGTIFNKYVLELRYPISLAPSSTIYGQVFVEGGNNWNAFKDFSPFNIKKSAGVGLRLFMPAFGLLGIDWAYGFDKLPNTNQISGPQFHFSIGFQQR